MSCPFYTFKDGDYHCLKVRNDVNDDIYYRYCRNYDYNDCPTYKGEYSSSGSSGCYLTSACVHAKGLPDDCTELTVLREFRDSWLRNQPNGLAEIAEYYVTAPKIVEAINTSPDAEVIWDELYNDLVVPCMKWIQSCEMEQAHKYYREVARKLAVAYL